MEKKIYWTIKITLLVVGLVAIFNTVPIFMRYLNSLLDLINNSEISPEFNLIMLIIGLYLLCKVMDTIVNVVYKLQKLLPEPNKEKEKK